MAGLYYADAGDAKFALLAGSFASTAREEEVQFADGGYGYAMPISAFGAAGEQRFQSQVIARQANLSHAETLDAWTITEGGRVLVIRFREQCPYSPVADAAALPWQDRRDILFQYVFALHEVYAKLGGIVSNAKVDWEVIRCANVMGGANEYGVKRADGTSWDLFKDGGTYELRLAYHMGAYTERNWAGINYANFCDALFPDMAAIRQDAPWLAKLVEFLRTGQWAADTKNKRWGPGMMLFHPGFGLYKGPTSAAEPSMSAPSFRPMQAAAGSALPQPAMNLGLMSTVAQEEVAAVRNRTAGGGNTPPPPPAAAEPDWDANKQALKATAKKLVDVWEKPRAANKQDVYTTGTPEIIAAYARLVAVYGSEDPISGLDDLSDGNAKYVVDSKLVPTVLDFYAYTGVGTYTTGPARIKNGAYIVLELIARATLPANQDAGRPPAIELETIVGSPGTLLDGNAQRSRIQMIFERIDPAEAQRKAQEEAEAARKAAEEAADRKAAEEAARQAREEADRRAAEEAARKAAEEAEKRKGPTMGDLVIPTGLAKDQLFGSTSQNERFSDLVKGFKVRYGDEYADLGLANDMESQVVGSDYRMAGVLHAMWGKAEGEEFAVIRGLSMANVAK